MARPGRERRAEGHFRARMRGPVLPLGTSRADVFDPPPPLIPCAPPPTSSCGPAASLSHPRPPHKSGSTSTLDRPTCTAPRAQARAPRPRSVARGTASTRTPSPAARSRSRSQGSWTRAAYRPLSPWSSTTSAPGSRASSTTTPPPSEATTRSSTTSPSSGARPTLEIRGLAAGQYDIFTYAAVPSGADHRTRVRIPSSSDPIQTVGGDFSGGYQAGVTHARHAVNVAPGSAVTLQLNVAAEFMSLNGIQVVSVRCHGRPRRPLLHTGGDQLHGLPRRGLCLREPPPRRQRRRAHREFAPDQHLRLLSDQPGSGLHRHPWREPGQPVPGRRHRALRRSGSDPQLRHQRILHPPPRSRGHATPTGLVSITAGEAWNFQAWYRDSLLGIPLSNLTDALVLTLL